MNTTTRHAMFYRHKLLASVSMAALLSAAYGTAANAASDADRPLLWIELGGQLSQQSGRDEPYIPPFADLAEQHGLLPLAPLQVPPKYSIDEELGLSFQPEKSDWVFSASVKYGRSGVQKHNYVTGSLVYYQFPSKQGSQYPDRNGQDGGIRHTRNGQEHFGGAAPFTDYHAQESERHVVLDFQAGKDVGLGLFGHGGTSEIALGVRIAQLTSKSKLKLYADPYPHMYGKKYFSFLHHSIYTNVYDQYYKASPEIGRSFRGLGPSLSWSGSTPMISLGNDSDLSFDWGINASILFGRQKARVQHHTSGTNWYIHIFPTASQHKYGTPHYVHNTRVDRSRNVTVPSVGGLAGFSLQFPNAKVSVGYKADFFLGALDGGVDTRKSETRGFFGPYASISIGLGD